MKAIGNFIVIDEINEPLTKTAGGLELTDKLKEDIRYRKAVVVEPGSEVKGLNKDDNIYYDKVAGFDIEIKKEQYKVIKESDVVIIL